jgi:hypothetical protein
MAEEDPAAMAALFAAQVCEVFKYATSTAFSAIMQTLVLA